MIDKLGDDKCFRGAYAYHLAVRDKINELVEEVNNLHDRSYAEYKEIITLEERLYKLEQHKHKTVGDAWKGETSEPITDTPDKLFRQCRTCRNDMDLNNRCVDCLQKYIKDLKQVIQEVYYLADRNNFCGKGMDCRLKNIIDILKPYIEEK